MSKTARDPKNYAAYLAEILCTAKTPKEMEELVHDLLTPAERKDLWERWCIVDQLLRGHSQRDASARLGVSVSKVTRGSRELQFGTGAFRRAWELHQRGKK